MRYLVVALLALSGCAPQMQGANSAGGIVTTNLTLGGQKKAFDLANAHCQKFGKVARVSGQSVLNDNVTFDCVAP